MEPNSGTSARFGETRWTVVLTAQAGDKGAEEALGELCKTYWYPVYAFLRRQGKSPHDAQDLTQGFFADVLQRDNWLGKVDRSKGKFRSFVLRCLQNYWSNERDREAGPTRNPGTPLVSLDATEAEERYILEPQDGADPARLFERKWAEDMVARVLDKLQAEYEARDAGPLFEALYPLLTGDGERGDVAPVAARLGKSEGTVRTALSRLRAHYGELVLAEIEDTVGSPAEAKEELQHLKRVFEY